MTFRTKEKTKYHRTSIFFQLFFLLLPIISIFSCCQPGSGSSLVNSSHLDHLYEEITVDSLSMAFIHIYADYPEYKWADAGGEGVGCVDDVARAIVFYIRQAGNQKNLDHESRAKKLLNFIFFMQAENGYFHNFIDAQHNIQKEIANSKPIGDWWSWRALWSLCEAEKYFSSKNPDYANIIDNRIKRLIAAMLKDTGPFPETTIENNFEMPLWLPGKYAADQAALIIIALAPYLERHPQPQVSVYLDHLAQGIIKMQVGDKNKFPYGAFLSWKNIWHAYGNSQGEALFLATALLDKPEYKKAALKEVNFFLNFQLDENFWNEFHFTKENDNFTATEEMKYPQISYGIRPMVFAALKAFDYTQNPEYLQKAANIAIWLFGANASGKMMYYPQNGRCFDGINNTDHINLNSGAESTIEALLIMQRIEQYPEANEIVQKYFLNREQ